MKTGAGAGNQRNHTVDVLKGICILFIVITHSEWSDAQRRALLFPYWISMAIPVFMIITGYVNALSYEKKAVKDLKQAYSPDSLLARFIRYTIPFIPVFILETVVDAVFKGKKLSIISLAIRFAQGGHGPGAYYYPIMIQVVIMLPVIWYVVKNTGKRASRWPSASTCCMRS